MSSGTRIHLCCCEGSSIDFSFLLHSIRRISLGIDSRPQLCRLRRSVMPPDSALLSDSFSSLRCACGAAKRGRWASQPSPIGATLAQHLRSLCRGCGCFMRRSRGFVRGEGYGDPADQFPEACLRRRRARRNPVMPRVRAEINGLTRIAARARLLGTRKARSGALLLLSGRDQNCVQDGERSPLVFPENDIGGRNVLTTLDSESKH
jgi:hypothetical protein